MRCHRCFRDFEPHTDASPEQGGFVDCPYCGTLVDTLAGDDPLPDDGRARRVRFEVVAGSLGCAWAAFAVVGTLVVDAFAGDIRLSGLFCVGSFLAGAVLLPSLYLLLRGLRG